MQQGQEGHVLPAFSLCGLELGFYRYLVVLYTPVRTTVWVADETVREGGDWRKLTTSFETKSVFESELFYRPRKYPIEEGNDRK